MNFIRKMCSARNVNELQLQKSPYLLQHAHNPVKWHAWTTRSHELAKARSVPIFLSIGYSTCHWCHVMERESFENEAIAAIMNDKFVNIKIDREEHPDVDRIYMSFVQSLSGSGGWPLSVFLTPDLKPIYGGTYFPPDSRYFGRPGFKSILSSISEQWEENKPKCQESANHIFSILNKNSSFAVNEMPDARKAFDKCAHQLSRSFEPSFGGFSESPKFPQPGNLVALIDYAVKYGGEKKYVNMVERTLGCMAKGGIYDHVGDGFARYSTDKKWHVPHFEKMLYDQAQLVSVYAKASSVCGSGGFKDICDSVVKYVNRDLSHADGGFFSAQDADSENQHGDKREGAFYVWTDHQVTEVLRGKEVAGVRLDELVKFRFGVKGSGNVEPYQDPHDELKNQNVLFLKSSVEECAEKFGSDVETVRRALGEAREVMLASRASRKAPGLDSKIICSWNGLMITGLCTASLTLGKKEYFDRAAVAFEFCKKHFITDGYDLIRTCYSDDGVISNLDEPILGCVDDFSNLISACLGLFQCSGDTMYIDVAKHLQEKQDELFWDGEKGGYFNSREKPDVIIRMKDDDDGAEPCANSISLSNLLQLSSIGSVIPSFHDSSYEDKITNLIKQFSDRLEKIPIAVPLMSSLVDSYVHHRVVVVFDHDREDVGELKVLPVGSVVVPVRDSSAVDAKYYVSGKITCIRNKQLSVVSSFNDIK